MRYLVDAGMICCMKVWHRWMWKYDQSTSRVRFKALHHLMLVWQAGQPEVVCRKTSLLQSPEKVEVKRLFENFSPVDE